MGLDEGEALAVRDGLVAQALRLNLFCKELVRDRVELRFDIMIAKALKHLVSRNEWHRIIRFLTVILFDKLSMSYVLFIVDAECDCHRVLVDGVFDVAFFGVDVFLFGWDCGGGGSSGC